MVEWKRRLTRFAGNQAVRLCGLLPKDEQTKVSWELSKSLGHFPLVSLCVEDVLDAMNEDEVTEAGDQFNRDFSKATEDDVWEACYHVWRKHPGDDDSLYNTTNWALDVLHENLNGETNTPAKSR